MNVYQWITAVQTVVMSLAAILTGLLYRGFQAGRWSQQIDKTKDIDALTRRMDKAGHQMSEFATDIQGMESRFRLIFVDQKVFEVVERELRNLAEGNRLEIERIWNVVPLRGNKPRP